VSSPNAHNRIKVIQEYFRLADQGRPEILELFHEDAEIYFPKFGFGLGRQSFFEMMKGFEGSLEFIQHDYQPVVKSISRAPMCTTGIPRSRGASSGEMRRPRSR
jgi:hypothetical protein